MGIFGKFIGGGGSKIPARIKQATKLLESGKLSEAGEMINELWEGRGEEISADDLKALGEVRFELCQALLKDGDGNREQALSLALTVAKDHADQTLPITNILVEDKIIDSRVLDLAAKAVSENPKEKRLLINLSKEIIEARGTDFSNQELTFLVETAKAFPLWKEGQGLLADLYLKEDRRDAEALAIYRNAYPNRKADRRLREVLLEALVLNKANDDFAASVYKDTVETSDNPEALGLLAENYIQDKQFTPATIPYITRALEKTKLSTDALEGLSSLVLTSTSEFIDRGEICLAIYRQGFSNNDLLAYLGEHLAQSNRFDDESIEIMTKAFELRMVSKRAILILTEHCLANDREDDFAIRIYESYLSTWPDRPQRRIYGILAHRYANLTRVDEQAQKIYQEALVDAPTDPLVMVILARAYHAADRRDETAEEIYRHTFPIIDGEIKQQIAALMAEIRVLSEDFSEETLQYLTAMGRPERGPLKDKYDVALTNCFLAAGRRGEQAQQAYFTLFERTADTSNVNPRLIELLADIIKERGVAPEPESTEMKVYRKLFELRKFSTDADVAFVLFEDTIDRTERKVNFLNLAVRCFEADEERFVKVVTEHNHAELLKEIGEFYIEHHNINQAARAYSTSFELQPSDFSRYRLAKIHLMEGETELALEHLDSLDAPEYKVLCRYWVMVAKQIQGKPTEADQILNELAGSTEVPEFLLKLRRALNNELEWEHAGGTDSRTLETALAVYDELVKVEEKDYGQFGRWLDLERGIVLMKLKRLEDARNHLEEIHRRNPNGRAEQLFLSLAMFLLATEMLQGGQLDESLPLFTRAVEVNRNHRLLRQVIVELLSLFGERAFFETKLEMAAKVLEVAHRILPKRSETKVFLAYTYHRLKQYAKAIMVYRDLSWGDEDPRLERSQAYAYLANQQPEKAWRVFLDLARGGNLLPANFPRLVGSFLADPEATEGRLWEPVEFPEDTDGLLLATLLVHDGLYEKATELIEGMLKAEGESTQLRWYLGKAYSRMNKRELAVYNWLELTKLVSASTVSPEMKIRQFTEIGLAFLAAGYAPEAMQTWDQLRQIDEKNADLPVLYAATLDLNAYQLARKDQNSLAKEEWKKSLAYDPANPVILQNFAIINLLMDDYDSATKHYQQLARLWLGMARSDAKYRYLEEKVGHLEKALNTLELTKGRSEFDLTKVRAEDIIDYYQKANQFYWILSLDKRATESQIEVEYFRLIKIFNPERHADDFMLVEESYSNLFKDKQRREVINLFVFNPIDVDAVRARLTRIPRDGAVSFEQLQLPDTVPPPDFQQLKPPATKEDELVQPLLDLLSINFKIPDWKIL